MKKPLRVTAKFLTFLILLSQMAAMFSQTTYGQQVETRQLTREKTTVDTEEKRVALVIGNGKYLNTKTLPNPVNDANDMSAKLRSLGFRVYGGTDLKKGDMLKLIREFGDELAANGGVGLFFYGGHGVQFEGENYLIPVDADIKSEDEIVDASISVARILSKLNTAKNDLNIILLDACRDNPFADSWQATRSTGSENGLTRMKTPKGTVLFYATDPGSVASDGAGRNGLFTSALLERMAQPDLELSQFTKTVIGDVIEKSKNKQTPWSESSFAGDFYFNKTKTKAPEQTIKDNPPPTQNTAPPVVSAARRKEENAWNGVKDSRNADDFKYFLEEFPEGLYAAEAKNMMEQLAWDAVRNTGDKEKIKLFLVQHPDGYNSASARIKIRSLEKPGKEAVPVPASDNSENKNAEKSGASIREIRNEEKATEKISEKTGEKNAVVKAPPVRKKSNALLKKQNAKLPNVTSQTDSLGIEFVLIPAGSFTMGATAANLDETYRMARNDYADFEKSWVQNELPAHRVEISEDYWMSKTEISQTQWEKVMGNNPSFNNTCRDCPVERVSWEDAKEFIKKLNEMNNGFVYSLPSEAEWEYAARGGTTRLFAGNAEELSWHSGNSDGVTHPVGERFPNSFGLYDMHGNVAEWCEDLYESNYEAAGSSEGGTSSAGKNMRVVRGGSWNVFPTLQRATVRNSASPSLRNIVTGFRLVARSKQ